MQHIKIYTGDYRQTLNDVYNIDLIFTSPPYNIGSKSPRRDGMRKLGKYDAKSFGAIRDYPDSLPENVYQSQQIEFMLWAADHLAVDGTLVYNHKPRRNGHMIHPAEWFLNADVRKQLTLMEEVIWDRGSTHNHGNRLLWPTTERLYVFRRTEGKYRFSNKTGLIFRSDIWRLPLVPKRTNKHNAPFLLALAEAVVLAWSTKGDLICDPYCGSGTTALAAKRHGRRFKGAEILPTYAELAKDRIDQIVK